MCFTKEMSAFFSLTSLAMAYYMYGRIGFRVAISILYFGSMELLQTVQYFYIAEPEDGFSMCKNPTNQFLTALGHLHICFQPFFANYAFGAQRVNHIQMRIEKDLVGRMCFIGGCWMFARYLMAIRGDPTMAPAPSEDCPNYEWVQQGYDAHLGWTTPNVPNHSCTFRSNTTTGHLAWAVPMYQPSYFLPHYSLHCFLMFVPSMLSPMWESNGCAIILFFTGPVLACVLSASLNEQGAIWCFFSMVQIFMLVIFMPDAIPAEPVLIHKGSLGEKPLEYALVDRSCANGATNGTSTTNGSTKKQD